MITYSSIRLKNRIMGAIAEPTAIRPWRTTWVISKVFCATAFYISVGLAQVPTSPITSSGLRTQISGPSPVSEMTQYNITGGTRAGANLFHSFGAFNVPNNNIANFFNDTGLATSNILSRVTEGNASNIFGTIQTTGFRSANLFLMNPSGIIFGPNASLNVGGSVTFTTADYLRLNDDVRFNAVPNTTADALLSTAAVAAFGFLNSNPADISIQSSSLEVQPGKSLSLIGGNITVESGTLGNIANPPLPSTPGKQVFIVSVGSLEDILAETLVHAENISSQSPGTLGTVRISQGSSIDTRGEGGGTILIRGGRLIVEDSIIGSNTGDIVLTSDSTLIKNTRIITFTTTTANAGHITLEASGDIELDSQARVQSLSEDGLGHAGNIMLRSNQGNVHFTKSSVTSQTRSGIGNSGNIEISAPHGNIRLIDNSLVFTSATSGTGTIGGIKIGANNLELLKGSRIDGDNFSTKTAGNMDIQLRGLLRLTGNSEIETTATGNAPAANLDIKAREVRIEDGSRLSADTTSSSSGSAGTIRISGPQDSLDSALSVLIDGPGSGIFTDTKGIGPGGTIDLSTQSLTLQNGGAISASTSGTNRLASGGSIIINAKDQVSLNNGASITASSTGPADAGNIFINAGQQLNLENSKITTEANQSKAGNINIQAIDQVRVVNGEISTSVHSGTGKGGDIIIDPKTVILQNGSRIFAQAVQGSGGNITITTPLYLIDSTSRVNADSQFGLNGSVTIQSPTSNLSSTVEQLASKTTPPQVLLQNRCIALAGSEQSTFILAGRDALPSEPGGWLSSPVAMEHWTGEGTEDHASGLLVQRKNPDKLPIMAAIQDQTTILSLRRLTPPGFLVRTFATGTAGCPS